MFGRLGTPELLLILAIALLVFGPKALPQLGKTLGKAIGSFKQGHAEAINELENDKDKEKDAAPQ